MIDKLPYLMDSSGAFESVLQRAWDREHQRGAQMTIGPLNPADVSAMAGLPAADAFDAALITGGLPIICARWKNGEDTKSFLVRELANPVSPLVVSANIWPSWTGCART